jgi:GT2 family glycosyltransferase
MIEIILLCRNRPEYANEALTSLCNIDYPNLKITISDNSKSPIFAKRNFTEEFPYVEINYLYRGPDLSASDHYSMAISSSKSEFICLFHDDDIALPNFIGNRLSYFNNPSVTAVGTNAYNLFNATKHKSVLFNSNKRIVEISNPLDLFKLYFSLNEGRVAPFPGYIYRRSAAIKKTGLLKSSANKYSDVVFLASLTTLGTIVWDTTIAMYYRKHLNNDSNFEILKDRIGLLGMLKIISKKDYFLISDYRFQLYTAWLPKTDFYKNNIKSILKYHPIIKKFLFFYSLKNSLRILKKIKKHKA